MGFSLRLISFSSQRVNSLHIYRNSNQCKPLQTKTLCTPLVTSLISESSSPRDSLSLKARFSQGAIGWKNYGLLNDLSGKKWKRGKSGSGGGGEVVTLTSGRPQSCPVHHPRSRRVCFIPGEQETIGRRVERRPSECKASFGSTQLKRAAAEQRQSRPSRALLGAVGVEAIYTRFLHPSSRRTVV